MTRPRHLHCECSAFLCKNLHDQFLLIVNGTHYYNLYYVVQITNKMQHESHTQR